MLIQYFSHMEMTHLLFFHETIMLWCWFLNLVIVYLFREKQFSLKYISVEIQKLTVITISHRNGQPQRLCPCEVGREIHSSPQIYPFNPL